MLESVEYGAKNRLATVFFYLNNVSAGTLRAIPRGTMKYQKYQQSRGVVKCFEHQPISKQGFDPRLRRRRHSRQRL
eukprot:4331464-Pleurochrysis_carterae.AAC.1